MSVESNLGLYWFCFTPHCDWSKKHLMPVSTPTINATVKPITTWSPTFSRTWSSLLVLLWVLIGSLRYFPFFWSAVMITFYVALLHSNEKRSDSLTLLMARFFLHTQVGTSVWCNPLLSVHSYNLAFLAIKVKWMKYICDLWNWVNTTPKIL